MSIHRRPTSTWHGRPDNDRTGCGAIATWHPVISLGGTNGKLILGNERPISRLNWMISEWKINRRRIKENTSSYLCTKRARDSHVEAPSGPKRVGDLRAMLAVHSRVHSNKAIDFYIKSRRYLQITYLGFLIPSEMKILTEATTVTRNPAINNSFEFLFRIFYIRRELII